MGDEQRPESGMIEIGDPTEDSPAVGAEPPPRVVIEYRDRGVPWLLLPPLLVLAAVVAVVATPAIKPEPQRASAPQPVPARPEPGEAKAPPVAVAATIPPVVAMPTPTPPPIVPAVETPAPAPVPAPVETPQASEPDPAPTPAPFPRVRGIGFDADALRADANPESPVDPALAPAGGKPAGEEAPTRADAAAPAEAEKQPVEVDPDVLPPDPRQARQLRLQRTAEARRKAQEERGRFHAELTAILRRQGDRSAPAIQELCLKYGSDVDPAVKQQAVKLLGASGVAAGVSRSVRINLLRSEGFPEAAILRDIFDQELRWISEEKGLSKAVRGGPRTMDEVFCSAAMILLNNPPRRAATPATTRPASDSRDGGRARPDRGIPSASRGPVRPGQSPLS